MTDLNQIYKQIMGRVNLARIYISNLKKMHCISVNQSWKIDNRQQWIAEHIHNKLPTKSQFFCHSERERDSHWDRFMADPTSWKIKKPTKNGVFCSHSATQACAHNVQQFAADDDWRSVPDAGVFLNITQRSRPDSCCPTNLNLLQNQWTKCFGDSESIALKRLDLSFICFAKTGSYIYWSSIRSKQIFEYKFRPPHSGHKRKKWTLN